MFTMQAAQKGVIGSHWFVPFSNTERPNGRATCHWFHVNWDGKFCFMVFILRVILGYPLYFLDGMVPTSNQPAVERENSRPITSWHVTLPSPQDTANYKAPRITARFCYQYSKTNKNFPSVMQEPITPQHV